MNEDKNKLEFTLRRGIKDKGYELYQKAFARGYYNPDGKSLIDTSKRLLNEQTNELPKQVSIDIELIPLDDEEEAMIKSLELLIDSYNSREEIKKRRRAFY